MSISNRLIKKHFLIFNISRAQRKITLTSRDDSAVNNLRPIKKPFQTHLLQPSETMQYPSMNLKLEMYCSNEKSTALQHQHQKWSTHDCSKWSGSSDMSLLSDLSDISSSVSSDPDSDLFLPDLSSSLDSLHSIEAFNFFNEKQNMAF